MGTRENAYRPWKGQQRFAIWLMVAALACLVLGYFRFIAWQGAVVGALILAGWAAQTLVRVSNRRFGQQLERAAIEEATRVFARDRVFRIRPNVRMRRGGDIDLVIDAPAGSIPCEIKSYIHWKTIFWFWQGKRERMAAAQVRKQAEYLRSELAIVWLPQGKRSFWHLFSTYPCIGTGTYLVYGDSNELLAFCQRKANS